ncbi:chitin synthase-domain-containing protein [Boletus reticuloceps]|uniref:chitin synthase n=1 Tax=Boletus reticuloceps TaxID=495285 RepID=A0A8I2YI06_9AGAM|nr:chitin synthase-domain-containing protein [Boletus reticuloceps]
MNPLELEIYHQIKNVIGVNPTFYEYLFTIDADTTVDPYSLNRLISAMVHDKKVLGVCGETTLSNTKQSVITMMQVYEYFISHHMAKAFESLFRSVTCLPGCFTLFRLRTPDMQKPLLILDYSQNRVDTLHMKNLLYLGEDRYLTTLLLKHFPMHKTRFVRDAHAYTVAPDDWKILLSQRRRWINSTIHNLGEFMSLDQIYGFCCFSMRFVVMVDLVSTLIQPITVAYIVYLIVSVAGQGKTIPVISLIMIGAVYGLQALVFVLRRKWDMVGWMVFYIIAILIFSFLLPIYSFWRMDDFSWGATCVVLGEVDSSFINMFKYSSGQDLTQLIDNLTIDSRTLAAQKTYLRNLLFLIGMVDNQTSSRSSFIASINFGSLCAPEDHDKYVICQVPCYTEGESSLRHLARLKYNDKRKL